ncbi:acyl-CoA thioesterase II [Novosphingobium sp. 1949]|uniref:Acyl-CoA thioesterase II n=1 Tax=Novosphingobium organovorum TaxID=2930092 RepID=A0ABT0BE86_9SPHN|nr:acyl-CoA thioesterase II [Novosphingobium organovorum]MCJ2183372.1 acyl-CoA thioesterase II [Novosphingobium organovorum]
MQPPCDDSERFERAVAQLRDLLSVEQLDTDLYRAPATSTRPGRVFGGQVIAQALRAAGHSVEGERRAHSLHAYFLRAGDERKPIIYRVLRDYDGGSFTHRRVVAVQDGRPILNLASSYHGEEPGFEHARAMPEVAPPEKCPDMASALAATGQSMPPFMHQRLEAFDVRVGLAPPAEASAAALPAQYFWFRLSRPMRADAILQRVVLAYASDFALLGTALIGHPTPLFSPRLQAASLDHAMWFHADPDLDDWLLYTMDSPWAGHARGFARGALFNRTGTLVASAAQEGLIRPVSE